MKYQLCFFLFMLIFYSAKSQSTNDTTKVLNEVIVNAYQYNRSLKETPVALGVITEKELNRFNNNSIVSAMNTIAGVRMEERSPGSYRFAIRGSSLRSPFGVRNVKFYWNGLPLTDGGGNTYLNLLDFDAFGRAEIIKGPGASLYGAATGGVVLLSSPIFHQNQIQISASGGSYGFQRYQVSGAFGNEKRKFFVNYAHQQSDGYRQQSALRRDAINLQGSFLLKDKSTIQTSIFYTDLYYQTPGGLTQIQYDTMPSLARPPGFTKGAIQQHAAIYNQTIYSALNYEKQWSSHWSTRIGGYGSYTDYTNPAIQNYERRTETNWGGRTDTRYEFEKNVKGKITFGAEYQYFYSPLTDYGNSFGVKDTLQNDDRLTSNSAVLFSQIELILPHEFYLTVGGSANFINYNFNRIAGSLPGKHSRDFSPLISPRVALLKKINESLSIFTSLSKGFSTPAWAEVVSNSGVYNPNLSPEEGINYEAGIRGNLLKNFSFDVVGYDFELSKVIVSESSGQAYINAGTSQKGIETFLSWQRNFDSRNISNLKIWTSCTFTNYKFNQYNYNGNNFTGKQLPSTAPKILVAGLGLSFFKNLYCKLTVNYVDKIALNDGNTAIASDYCLLGGRLGFKNKVGRDNYFEIFSGVDNALNQKYSLGNDLNALGSRYFNAAALRNFYFGIKFVPRF